MMQFRWPRLHFHDYEMVFPMRPSKTNEWKYSSSLDWEFVCKCGDVVPDQETAWRKMKYPVIRWGNGSKVRTPTDS